MKIACVTTTINVPRVIELYNVSCGTNDVMFFVVGDCKTDNFEVSGFLGNHNILHFYFSSYVQNSLGHSCSERIGWNTVARRNIGFLEALKWGAEIVISFDDDNIPIDTSYIHEHVSNLICKFNGLCNFTDIGNWFDAGSLLQPKAKHRGFPYHTSSSSRYRHCIGANVGVSAGISLGDPDIDATTRMALAPEVHSVSQLLQAGIVNDPRQWTVFNSQATAIIRELIPAWGMVPYVGRMDDIYASLVCQRVMRDRDLHVRFGKPFVWQSRNEHDLVRDLRNEFEGYDKVRELADWLYGMPLPAKSVCDDVRSVWRALSRINFFPQKVIEAMLAYVDDCERILG